MTDCVHGQHTDPGGVPGSCSRPYKHLDTFTTVPGLCNQSREVGTMSHEDNRLPGYPVGLHPKGVAPPTKENQKDTCGGTEDSEVTNSICVHTSKITGEDEHNFVSYMYTPSSPVLPPPTNKYGLNTTGKQSKSQCLGTDLMSNRT